MLRGRALSVAVAERSLVRAFDFELPTSYVLAVCGPSGSGKTTLLRAIAWLHPLTTGTLTLDDRSAADVGACTWRSQIAYVAQQPPALPSSGEAFLAEVARFRTQSSRDAGQLSERAHSLSRSWELDDQCWRQDFADLSGGERQRLYLALVLATNPRVLLLDEPTSALDATSRERVESELKSRSAIWVTHDRAQAERVGDEIREIGA